MGVLVNIITKEMIMKTHGLRDVILMITTLIISHYAADYFLADAVFEWFSKGGC